MSSFAGLLAAQKYTSAQTKVYLQATQYLGWFMPAVVASASVPQTVAERMDP